MKRFFDALKRFFSSMGIWVILFLLALPASIAKGVNIPGGGGGWNPDLPPPLPPLGPIPYVPVFSDAIDSLFLSPWDTFSPSPLD